MYRQTVKCEGMREDIFWNKKYGEGLFGIRKTVTCNNETGYVLISHATGNILVEARKECSLCGMKGINEEAFLWDIMPAGSSYCGATIYQMALAAESGQRLKFARE